MLTLEKEEYDYNLFCCQKKVTTLFGSKDMLDSVHKQAFLDARRRSNPYEIIGKSIFINRAAVKMANLDYLCRDLIPSREQAEKVRSALSSSPGQPDQLILWSVLLL